MKYFNKPFFRFLITGSLNTGITYFIYIFLLLFVHYNFAYTLSFACGILISYVLYSKFVFQQELSFKKFFRYPIIPVSQYFLGIVLLNFFIKDLAINKVLAPILVVIITVPYVYLLNGLILRGSHEYR